MPYKSTYLLHIIKTNNYEIQLMNMKLPTSILKEMQCPSYWSVQK